MSEGRSYGVRFWGRWGVMLAMLIWGIVQAIGVNRQMVGVNRGLATQEAYQEASWLDLSRIEALDRQIAQLPDPALRVALQQLRQVEPTLREEWRTVDEGGNWLRLWARKWMLDKKFALSEQWYLWALELNPDSAEIKGELATLYQETGRLEEAEESLEQSTNQDETKCATWYQRGEVATKQEKWFEAAEAFVKVLSLAETDTVCRYQTSHVAHRLGVIYHLRLKQEEKGWEYYQLALSADQYDPTPQQKGDTYYQIASILSKRKLWSQAIAQYQLALAIRPDYYIALIGLAQAQLQAGDLAEAQQSAEQARDLAPEQHPAYRVLGDIYRTRGENELARQMYEKVLSINPNNEAAKEGLEKLPR